MKCCGGEINPLTLMLAAKIGAKAVQCGDRVIVWWLGIRWYGIPMPARIAIALAVYERRLLEDGEEARWPDLCQPGGCGCIVVLKDLAERFVPRLAAILDRCSRKEDLHAEALRLARPAGA